MAPVLSRSLTLCAALAFTAALLACARSKDETDAPAAPAAGMAPAADAARAADRGQTLYSQNCVPCHREDGKGLPNVYPGLAQSPVANGDPAELVRWVLAGKRPASMPAGRYSTQMLQFGWMKDADAAALLTYVRSHFGNTSPPLDAATVAAARP